MSRLTRDGTAEPVSRHQILRHARGQGNVHFPSSADHEQDWQPYPVDPYSAICDDHTYSTRKTQSCPEKISVAFAACVVQQLRPRYRLLDAVVIGRLHSTVRMYYIHCFWLVLVVVRSPR